MDNKITKEEVIAGIETLTKMIHIWYNDKVPNSSFNSSCEQLKETLLKLLEVKDF